MDKKFIPGLPTRRIDESEGTPATTSPMRHAIILAPELPDETMRKLEELPGVTVYRFNPIVPELGVFIHLQIEEPEGLKRMITSFENGLLNGIQITTILGWERLQQFFPLRKTG